MATCLHVAARVSKRVLVVDDLSYMRDIQVLHQDPAVVAVSKGIEAGEIIVTAGVHALHPGQKVRLPGSGP